MGGLRKYLPVTHAVMLVGVLAIIGFPGLSGFFSKDEILWRAYVGGGPILWGGGVIAAGCTSFYMVRLLCLTFYGPNRSDHHTRDHLHETPPVMWLPLVVLAVLSIGVGYLGVPEVFGVPNLFEHYFQPVIMMPAAAADHWKFLTEEHSHGLEFGLMAASVAVMFVASGLAIKLYGNGPAPVLERWKNFFSGTYRTLQNKYFVDEGYDAAFVRPLKDMSMFLYRIVDVGVIDGIVNGVGQLCMLAGGVLSFRMTGSLHRHGMAIVIGLLCLLSLLIVS